MRNIGRSARRSSKTWAMLALAAAGTIPTVAKAQSDQFQFYFNGSVATNGSAIGAATYDQTNNVFYTGSFGASASIRKISYSGSWSGATQVGQTDWVGKFLASSSVSDNGGNGTFFNPPYTFSTTIGNILLNPASLTMDSITYPAGTVAIIVDQSTVRDGSSVVQPQYSKEVYSYDLRVVGGAANQGGGLSTRDRNSNGVADWNDVFNPLATMADFQAAQGSTSTTLNIGRRPAFSTDGQSLYICTATTYSGIFKLNLTTNALTKIVNSLNGTTINVEPAVVHTSVRDMGAGFGTGDQIFFQGSTDTGNIGGLNYVVDTGASVSSAKVAVSAKSFAWFFDQAPTYTSLDVRSVCAGSNGDVYIQCGGPSTGFYRYDSAGRLVKIASESEVRLFNFNNGNFSFSASMLDTEVHDVSVTLPDTSVVTLPQVMYDAPTFNSVAGINVYKPGDFNRDNVVDSTDVNAFKAQLGLRGAASAYIGSSTTTSSTQLNALSFKYDLNGSFTTSVSGTDVRAVSIDWRDWKILQQFAGLSDGDVNMDGAVDNTDLVTIMGGNYGGTGKLVTQGNLTSVRPSAVDKDDVNFADLVTLAANWPNAKPALGAIGSIPQADVDRAFAITANGTISEYIKVAGGSDTWSTTGSWSNGVVPNSAGAVASLLTKPQSDTSISINSSYTVGQLNFDNFFTYTLGGTGTLHLNGNGTTAEINCFAASPAISTNLALDSNTNVTMTYSADIATFSGNISGTGNLTKLGAGVLQLSGTNTYGGTTTVSAGTLQATKAAALPGYNAASQVSVASGATLALSAGAGSEWTISQLDALRSNVSLASGSTLALDTSNSLLPYVYPSSIGGSGFTVSKIGNNTLKLTGANTYSGNTAVSVGTLQASAPAALSGYNVAGKVSVASGAILAVNAGGGGEWASVDIDTLRTNATFASGASLGVDTTGGTFTYGSNVAGTGLGLVKLGANTLRLTGASTYTGPTASRGGNLQLDFSAGVLTSNIAPAASQLQLSNGGGLTVTGRASSNQTQTFAGVVLSPGAASITMSPGATNNLLLSLGAITRNVGSTLEVTLSGTSSATNGVLTSTGVTTSILSAGLTVGKTDWAGKSTNNIVALASYTSDSWNPAGTATASQFNTTVTSSSAPAADSITNSLRFNSAAAATITLSGTSSITSGGILVTPAVGANNNVITGGTLRGRASSDLIVHQHNTGGSLTIASNLADNDGATGLTKSGDGNLTVSGTLSYTGATTVNAGTLLLQSNLTTSPSVSVTGGALKLDNTGGSNRVVKTSAVSVTNAGKIDLTNNKLIVAGADAGGWIGNAYTGISGLVKNGQGTVTGVQPSWNGSGIVTSETAATTSTLTTIGVAAARDAKNISGSQTATFGGQTVTATDVLAMYTYAGDANLDGSITGDDYFRIDSGNLAATSGYVNGDFDYSGTIDADDYFIIDRNYSRQGSAFPAAPPAGLAAVSAVPEPATIGLSAMALALIAPRRRRSK